MFINHTTKQVNAKIVYYGPGLSGKTSNLQYIFSITNPKSRGELVSIETEIERTLFFDLLPINVGLINGYQTKFQLYTVPGQIFYDSTRKLVLKGADGIVFVVDSQELMEQANLDSFSNLEKNLADQKQDIKDIPLVIQYNKRDLKSILSIERLNEKINRLNKPYFEAVATKGTGVIETLRDISSLTLMRIREVIESSKTPKVFSRPTINFDTDPNHRILSKEELPLKKINIEAPQSATAEAHIDHEFVSPKATIQTAHKPLEVKKEPMPAPVRETVKPKAQAPVSPSPSLGDLDQFSDPSRITLIRKLEKPGSKLDLLVRNANGQTIDELSITLDPKTKKLSIIFDITK
jgi:signal recognition particle receptor subunit beta